MVRKSPAPSSLLEGLQPPYLPQPHFQPQVENFQSENREFESGCEYASLRLRHCNSQNPPVLFRKNF